MRPVLIKVATGTGDLDRCDRLLERVDPVRRLFSTGRGCANSPWALHARSGWAVKGGVPDGVRQGHRHPKGVAKGIGLPLTARAPDGELKFRVTLVE